jgi:hypothetical protein
MNHRNATGLPPESFERITRHRSNQRDSRGSGPFRVSENTVSGIQQLLWEVSPIYVKKLRQKPYLDESSGQMVFADKSIY